MDGITHPPMKQKRGGLDQGVALAQNGVGIGQNGDPVRSPLPGPMKNRNASSSSPHLPGEIRFPLLHREVSPRQALPVSAHLVEVWNWGGESVGIVGRLRVCRRNPPGQGAVPN
jgi:hypothetical protein